MFTDARELPDHTGVQADLAIIGGGAAGITVARALAGTGLRICLAESGGMQYDPDVQALYDGQSVGIDYSLTFNRLRYFGGSTNHWGGYCSPLDPIDFEKRDWVPHSGWPFGREEIEPYYSPACEVVEIGPPRFEDLDYWRRETGAPLLAQSTGRFRTRVVQFSPPTRFGQRYGAELAASKNVQVLLNATVVNIAAAPNGDHITHLGVRTLTGLTHRIRARRFVLATGALENPRLLLLSDDVVRPGLGNQHDLVGRYFMEHPHLSGFGEMVVAQPKRLPSIYYNRVKVEGHSAQAGLVPTKETLRNGRLLNATFMMGFAGEYRDRNRPGLGPGPTAAHKAMLRAARRFLADGTGPLDPSDPSYAGIWLGIGCACEQAPNPDSRLSLSNELDALGQRKSRLDWRLSSQDRHSVVHHIRMLGLELASPGIGRMLINVDDDGIWPEQVSGGSHHMGTTRMHDDPKQGVVDRNCRVHGIDNLYVAGSSVFPTSGASNPTLNLVALALRLADHLKAQRT